MHKDKKSQAERKQAASPKRLEQKCAEELKSTKVQLFGSVIRRQRRHRSLPRRR